MIEWAPTAKEAIRNGRNEPMGGFHYCQRSKSPPGYIITLVPHGALSHLVCWYTKDPWPTFIGEVRDLPSRPLRDDAAKKLRAMAEKHAKKRAAETAAKEVGR